MRKIWRASPVVAEHVPATEAERDGDAMRRLREAVPKGWVIDAQGPVHYLHGVTEWEVEVCDPSHSHCDRGFGATLDAAADRCRERLEMSAGR